MRVFKNNYKVGNEVLFLWEQSPYTGIINSIGETTYGIIPDASCYETDKMMIPRLEKEVFIPKSLCKHTGEIFIDHKKNSPYRTRYQYKFGDDINRAYEMLPKKSIYPDVVWDTNKQFIEFIPDKMFFKTNDGNIYFYVMTLPLCPQLVTNNCIVTNPHWLYQLSEKSGALGYDTVTEDDIVKIWKINDHVEGINPWDALKYGYVDVIYDRSSVTTKLTSKNTFSPNIKNLNVDMDKVIFDISKK